MKDRLLSARDIYYRYFRFDYDNYESFESSNYMSIYNNKNRRDKVRIFYSFDIGETAISENQLKDYFKYKSYLSKIKLKAVDRIIEVEEYFKENGYSNALNRTCYVLKCFPREIVEPSFGIEKARSILKMYDENFEEYKKSLKDKDKKVKYRRKICSKS